jgi:hypothetical protein
MAAPENIEIFNRICVALFDKLYSAFPVPVEIDVNDLAMSAIPQDASYENAWDVLSAGGEAINFLAEEGFLTHKGAMLDGSQYLQVRLTMKGLAVLGYVPTSIEKQEPLISQIRSVVGGGLKEAGGETVRQLVSKAFSLALAAAPAVGALIGKP